MANLISIGKMTRAVADLDWPVVTELTVDFGEGVESSVFVYDPNDPFGDLNPQVAAWLLSNPDFPIDPYVAPPEPPPPPLALVQVAAAQLVVDGWDITGVERSQGISGAFMLSEDLAYVMFTTPFPSTAYVVIPDDGVTKYPDHVEVSHPGLTEVSFIIQRVQ